MNHNRTDDKIAPLTSLRFFAAAAVLLFHSGSTLLIEGGWLFEPLAIFVRNGYLGVSFFFILSGFILHYVYSGSEWSAANLRRYAIARFARVYPIYLLSLALAGILIGVWKYEAVAQFFLLQSWLPSAIKELPDWNFVAWSLSVELLFYLTFPLASKLVFRAPPATILMMTVMVALLMLVLQLPYARVGALPYTWIAYIPLPLLRYPEFLYGILLCEISYASFDTRWIRHATWPLVLTTVAVLSASSSPAVAGLAASLFGVVIYVTAQAGDTSLYRILSNRGLVLLGGSSYALYLLQFPVRMALGEFMQLTFARALYYPVLLTMAITLFLYFEEPVRSWLKTRSRAHSDDAIEKGGAQPSYRQIW